MDKNLARLRRAKATRSHIRKLNVPRLTVHRSDQHIYAQVISADGAKVLAAASTVQKDLAKDLKGTKNKAAAAAVGKAIAEKAKAAGVEKRRVRSFRFPLSRPHCGAGGCGARRGLKF